VYEDKEIIGFLGWILGSVTDELRKLGQNPDSYFLYLPYEVPEMNFDDVMLSRFNHVVVSSLFSNSEVINLESMNSTDLTSFMLNEVIVKKESCFAGSCAW